MFGVVIIFFKEVCYVFEEVYSHQDCNYLIKNTVKTAIILQL